jgi:cytochrome c peroxidase
MRLRIISSMAALLVIGSAGCQRAQETGQAPAARADLGSGELTKADLAVFAPLPARMVAGVTAPTDAQVDLGRTLYYETVLSGGHNVSCNSCHPLNAFGADGRARSFGDHGQTGGRNAPSVYNAADQIAQFWDGRAASVEEQAKGPVLNPAEMGMPNSDAVLEHLRASAAYRQQFAAAFPTEKSPITYDNLGKAIGAFERGLVTPARWDNFLGGDDAALTVDEKRGAKIFVAAGCSGCHGGAYVGGSAFMKAGLKTPWPATADSGRYAVTRKPDDMWVFKVPSLRNVDKTGPYFSDGAEASLDNAIRLMGRHQLGMEFNDTQLKDLRAFLGALSGTIPVPYIAQPQLPKARTGGA